MEIFPKILLRLSICSFFFGAILSVGYDTVVVAIHQLTNKMKKVILGALCFVADFLFFIVGAAGICVLTFYFNDGDQRGFSIISAIFGCIVYRFLLRKTFIVVLNFIFLRIYKLFSLFFSPFLIFFAFLGKKCNIFLLNIIFTLAKYKKKCYNKYDSKKVMKLSESGFLNQHVY